MSYQSKVTTDQETIRAWVEERGGKPARVKDASRSMDDLLRIAFEPDPDLEDISWDEFFDNFEEHRLAFLYQDETKEGEESRFCKFIYREEDDIIPGGKRKKKKKEEEGEEGVDGDDTEEEAEEDIEEDEGFDADDEEEDEM